MPNALLIDYLINYQASLTQIDLIKELFMIPDRMEGTVQTDGSFVIQTYSPLYKGKLFVDNGLFYALDTWERVDDRSDDLKTYHVTATTTGLTYDPNNNQALCTPQDSFILNSKAIANYHGDPLTTTIGIFVANYIFLVYPFGDVIDYINDEFTSSKLEKKISLALLQDKITVSQIKDKYVNALTLFGGSPEIISPNISEKTITVPDSINKLREKLVAENREALEAGDASVMADIEKQLISAYKDYLQGDPSLHFLLKKKYFDVVLKKLFLTQGITEVFGSPGKFTFIDNPMGSGWKVKDLPAIYNEVRQGSYARAIETADGGVVAKLILRVLQDTRIDHPDCQTTRGEKVHTTKEILKDFEWNYIINKDGSNTCITQDNMNQFVDQDVVIRTPGYCQEPTGFCAKCFGFLFEQIGQNAFAPIAVDLGSSFTRASLKSMHGKSHAVVDISNLDRYLISA